MLAQSLEPFELYPDPAVNIQNVVTPPEGVREDGTGPEVDIRVPAGGLAGGAAIEVPDGQCVDVPLLAVVAGLESLQAGVRVRVRSLLTGLLSCDVRESWSGCCPPRLSRRILR